MSSTDRGPADEPSPAEMLALLRQQQRRVSDEIAGPVPAILMVWGVAWLVGFLALWLTAAVPGFALAPDVAGWTFASLIFAAIVLSAVLGIWGGRGIKSGATSSFQGAVYGISWSVSLIAVTAIGVGLVRSGMDGRTAALFFPSAYCLVVGILYLAGAALWRAIPMLVAGPWLLLIAAVAPFLGLPHNYLLMAVGGGGAFLGVGIAAAVVRRRQHRSPLDG